jgi:hypothetical protein
MRGASGRTPFLAALGFLVVPFARRIVLADRLIFVCFAWLVSDADASGHKAHNERDD